MGALQCHESDVANRRLADLLRRVPWSVAVAMLVVGGACSRAGTRSPASVPMPMTEPPPGGTSSEVQIDLALRSFIDRAVADLARRRKVDAAAIRVVEARAVVWPDASLGCPRPGMEYTQVLQEGLLIRLELGGRTYAYHGGGSRMPELCETPPAAAVK